MENNKIVLFINKKNKPTDPDFSGRIETSEGKPLQSLVLWKNYSKQTGAEYYSGYASDWKPRATATDDTPTQAPAPAAEPATSADVTGEIDF